MFSTPVSKKRKSNVLFTATPQTSSVGNTVATSGTGKKYKNSAASKGLAKYIKAVVRGDAEKKEVLTNIGATLNATQSSVQLVSGCAQGDTGITRTGLSVCHSYIEINLGITNSTPSNSTGPYAGDWGFWALVLDRQPNGALPGFGAIFDDSVGGQSGNDFRITTTYQDRFKILKRGEWSVGSAGSTAGAVTYITGAPPYHCKIYVPLDKLRGNDQKAMFSGTGATIASIDEGSIYFVVASVTSDADNITSVIGQCKYRFTDL